ncbi:MAG: tRNA uridine-5-carboxymethylaminomethyl(34) synthesis GTPase MnmE [Alcaligenaceae bacterium]|nr:tRNA uridine-5-carboxymethylaminomethyl(34) synthesis GTPase MnmE [Alcaligenaceae bacterium]
MSNKDPIVAIATAPGRGGIGVVRVSAPELAAFIKQFFGRDLTARHAHYLPFADANGQAIDEGIALFFKGPHSYTGEDVLELQGHGGPAVLKRVIDRCIEVAREMHMGLRHAEPGEFTQRAFLNNRLDLAQAEAVADLIDASSEAAARSAMESLSGVFSGLVNALADRVIHLRMLVEATLDFPEEEIEFLEKYQAREELNSIQADLQHLIQQARQGMILREGMHVVLAGQPNVGKSSLLNALAGDDVAIVTPIAGTTRDKVIRQIHIQGVPIHIVDTAGLRETDDTVESIGIARTWAEIEKANVIVHLQDARSPNDELDADITRRLPARTPVLKVFNKLDLLSEEEAAVLNLQISETTEEAGHEATGILVSAKKETGLDALRQKLLDIAGWNPSAESPWLARERHLHALNSASEHLAMAEEHASYDDRVLDLFAEELRLAHDELCKITGQFSSDDLLGEIFSSFCIGK